MKSILPVDELNRLEERIKEKLGAGELPKSKQDADAAEDMLLDFFLYSYSMGNEATNASLSNDYKPGTDDIMKVIDEEVAGKTWRERVQGYFSEGGTEEDITRIAATEAHRIANKAAYEAAKAAGAKTKTWHCMMLPTSRDTHIYLDGVSAPIDGKFYSFKGNETLYPGQWGVAEEDVNCLCFLTFDR